MPPLATPIRARSRTERVLRRAWFWGFRVGVGFKEVEAKERSSSQYFWLIFFFLIYLKVVFTKDDF